MLANGTLSTVPPRPSPHVIIASTEDVPTLIGARWNVHKTTNRQLAKYVVSRRICGRSLARTLFPDAPVLKYRNDNGCDVRRENLIQQDGPRARSRGC